MVGGKLKREKIIVFSNENRGIIGDSLFFVKFYSMFYNL